MAPEQVLSSPSSGGGLLRGEEVVCDEILEVVGEGGEDAMLSLSRLVEGGLDERWTSCCWTSDHYSHFSSGGPALLPGCFAPLDVVVLAWAALCGRKTLCW